MEFDWIQRRSWSRSGPSIRYKLLLAAALAVASSVAVALPAEFSARYEVSHSGFTLGEARVHFERVGEDGYRYSSLTRPVGITSLFYKVEIQELSVGTITDDGYRPDRYHYDRRGNKAREASLTFNWDRRHVINNVAGNPWQMAIPQGTLDRMVSQLQLMHDLGHDDDELVYEVADGGKLRVYELRVVGRETLDTAYGRFKTVKITRKEKSDKRATTFWCAPALDYLPVRIDHREKGDNFVMTLETLKGFPLGDGAR